MNARSAYVIQRSTAEQKLDEFERMRGVYEARSKCASGSVRDELLKLVDVCQSAIDSIIVEIGE